MNPVDPSKVYRLLYPAVPVIVACRDGKNVYAMPVVSIISLSNDPSLVGISSSAEHLTHKAILKTGRFSVSWLDASYARAVELLGTTSHTSPDKLRSAGLGHEPGGELGVPIVQGAVAALECSLSAREPIGDHELLVGKVVAASAIEDFQGYWRFRSYDPLLYAGVQRGALRTFHPGRA